MLGAPCFCAVLFARCGALCTSSAGSALTAGRVQGWSSGAHQACVTHTVKACLTPLPPVLLLLCLLMFLLSVVLPLLLCVVCMCCTCTHGQFKRLADAESVSSAGLPLTRAEELLGSCRQELFDRRASRPRPALDDKAGSCSTGTCCMPLLCLYVHEGWQMLGAGHLAATSAWRQVTSTPVLAHSSLVGVGTITS